MDIDILLQRVCVRSLTVAFALRSFGSSRGVKLVRGVRCRAASKDSWDEGVHFTAPDASNQDWRTFRAHLVAWEHASRRAAERTSQLQRPAYPPFVAGESWAHPLAEPEQGCLLLARQDSMSFFSGAVILLTTHNDATGSVGYVLNKPSPLKVDELQVLGAASGFKEAFGCQRLHLGGPVHVDHVTLLHRFMCIGRSQKIAEGMYMGGLPDAIRMVDCGLAHPSDFQLVLGMSGWAAGQLREEIQAGYWHVISASPDLVLPSPSSPAFAAASPRACSGPSSPAAETADARRPVGAAEASEGQGAAQKGRSAAMQSPMYRRIARLAMRGA
ncbi:hypothetical protein GPECTOR_78g90 [Gonium pectorale]|uniref:YqgE/AlgH family protein n=1 Tax=Gonium pectorale TaxID=33097 RepID=A0A150G208_GONPE|nr:hypothetical protein GPECTOR_78g90 [Gonium pectorale]|eukprot:KXZ43902.1 hypothetical protein GPECTOR_78g90 [Gonium pectorale]